MRLAALVVASLGMLVALRFMIVFLWRARRSEHDLVAWAIAASAGAITGFAALVVADLVLDLGRWLLHLVAGLLFSAMFPAWHRIMDVLMTIAAGAAGDQT